MTLATLRRHARRAAAWRGHTLRPFVTAAYGSQASTSCKRCQALAIVDADPPPNGIDIGGSAVAMNCPRSDHVPHDLPQPVLKAMATALYKHIATLPKTKP